MCAKTKCHWVGLYPGQTWLGSGLHLSAVPPWACALTAGLSGLVCNGTIFTWGLWRKVTARPDCSENITNRTLGKVRGFQVS